MSNNKIQGTRLTRTALFFYLATTLLALTFSTPATAQTAPAALDWQPPAFEHVTAPGGTFRYPEDLRGPTIVLFWATWCPYCKALMPHLQSIVDEYRGEVQVLALNFREDDDPAVFIEKYGYEFLLLPDADDVARAWGVKGTPGLFLVEQSGRLVFSRHAIPDSDYRPARFADSEKLTHTQKAARNAPFWAARLREAIDQLEQP